MKNLKDQLRLIFKAFFKYGKGFSYLYWRYIVAPQIVHVKEPLERPITRPNLSIHMLFGARDFLIACWSLASFYRASSVTGQLYLHSDGTLIDTHIVTLKRLFPGAIIIDAKNILSDHKDFFASHPDLHEFRATYIKFQAKKLLDPYLSSSAPYRLILDSDILWFSDPEELRIAVDAHVPMALMMSDATGQGGFAYVIFKDGTSITDEIASYNSGITLYRSEQFDLQKFSEYLSRCDYLRSRFTDQACYASIFMPHLSKLPESKYIIKGTITDTIVARHYTNPSRAKFYFYGLNFIADAILDRHVRN